MKDDIIIITEVGSRMWGMAKPDSDYDLYHIFMQSSREYLRTSSFEGNRPAKTYMDGDKEIDAQYMEIGHLVGLLKKGNVNAIWATCSPIVYKDCPALHQLQEIVKDNLSSQTYASVNGMAHSQINDTVKRAAVKDPQKNRDTAARTLQFGINLIKNGKIEFKPFHDATPEIIGELFRELENARNTSELPEVVFRHPFEEFLYELRLKEIINNDLSISVE
jgi:predicted nucleotidyltransferase